MKTARSQIFPLSVTDHQPGTCSICGCTALLKWRDASTGFVLGNCCLRVTLQAERALMKPKNAMHHPVPGLDTQNS